MTWLEKFREREFLFALLAKLQFAAPFFGVGHFNSAAELIARAAVAGLVSAAYVKGRLDFKAAELHTNAAITCTELQTGNFASETVH